MTPTTRSMLALLAALALSACELIPCAVDPDLPACDQGGGSTDDDTDGPPGPCPAEGALWSACGPGDDPCDGWPCVVADAPAGADVCAAVCTYPGQPCNVQVPYCEDPMSSGQVLQGVCVADESAPDGYGVCVESCEADSGCTFPGEVCGTVADGVAACVWPSDECEPAPGTAWGACAIDGPALCGPGLTCRWPEGGSICAPACPSDGEPCELEVDACGPVAMQGVCSSGVCAPTCDATCPFDGMACSPFGLDTACLWPNG